LTLARHRIPNVLSIAGSDPSGGAGIQADLKTFAALGCHGMAVITALTAQNTRGVSAVHLPPAPFVAQQIAMIFADIDVHAIKIGMLGSAAVVEAVAAALEPHRDVPIVFDPVLVATSGAMLGDDGVIDAMRRRLFPIATIITPNLAEASRLAAMEPLVTASAMDEAARRLKSGGAAAWLVKGGHSDAGTADDLLLDGAGSHWLSSVRVATRNTHGTGCTLSSAIAAHLALGAPLREAVEKAKRYIDIALAGADGLAVGHGPGPVDHFAAWR
jgi:hydroxymethylpyrimidine/phosphomethylpyrimidine kinase